MEGSRHTTAFPSHGGRLSGTLHARQCRAHSVPGEVHLVTFDQQHRRCDPVVRLCRSDDASRPVPGTPARTRSKAFSALHGRYPVSYTHLTLPTIYSV